MKLTWWLGVVLGILLIVDGIAETMRLTRSGDGGFAFWFGTLVGGGSLILAGTLLRTRFARIGPVLVMTGCVVAIVPTMWTIVFPLLLLALLIVTARESAAEAERRAQQT